MTAMLVIVVSITYGKANCRPCCSHSYMVVVSITYGKANNPDGECQVGEKVSITYGKANNKKDV